MIVPNEVIKMLEYKKSLGERLLDTVVAGVISGIATALIMTGFIWLFDVPFVNTTKFESFSLFMFSYLLFQTFYLDLKRDL